MSLAVAEPVTDTPLPKAPVNEFFKKRCSLSENTAFLRYMKANAPSLDVFHKLLVAEGEDVSLSRLKTWASRSNWIKQAAEANQTIKTGVLNVIEMLKVDSSSLDEKVFGGIQIAIAGCLGKALTSGEIKITTPKDVDDMVTACEHVRALSHAVRGDAFGKSKNGAVAALNGTQVVNLGSFKAKTNGNGAAHG